MAIETVDFNINGACNLQCPFCWGPDHTVSERVTIPEWKQIATNFRDSGVKHIVFTGGEPLLREGVEELAGYIHGDLGMHTTLSTNGILLPEKRAILDHFDEVGIPIDGPTPLVNSIMRVGMTDHLTKAFEAIRLIQTDFPQIDLTVRTVVSRRNYDWVPEIGPAIKNAGVDIEHLRWKLYQYQPIGPRAVGGNTDLLWIGGINIEDVIKETEEKNPDFHIEYQSIADSDGRYLHIQPGGLAVAIKRPDCNSLPQEIILGDILEDFPGIFKMASSILNKNRFHGVFNEPK